MPGKVNESIWKKAKDAFKKQYKHDAKSAQDFSIVSQIYKKMGGKFGQEMLELAEQIQGLVDMKEENYLTRLERMREKQTDNPEEINGWKLTTNLPIKKTVWEKSDKSKYGRSWVEIKKIGNKFQVTADVDGTGFLLDNAKNYQDALKIVYYYMKTRKHLPEDKKFSLGNKKYYQTLVDKKYWNNMCKKLPCSGTPGQEKEVYKPKVGDRVRTIHGKGVVKMITKDRYRVDLDNGDSADVKAATKESFLQRLERLSEGFNQTSKLGKKVLTALKSGKSSKEIRYWLKLMNDSGAITGKDFKVAWAAVARYDERDMKGFEEDMKGFEEDMNKMTDKENYKQASKLSKSVLDALKKGKSVKDIKWWFDLLYNSRVIDGIEYNGAIAALDAYKKKDKKSFDENYLTKLERLSEAYNQSDSLDKQSSSTILSLIRDIEKYTKTIKSDLKNRERAKDIILGINYIGYTFNDLKKALKKVNTESIDKVSDNINKDPSYK